MLLLLLACTAKTPDDSAVDSEVPDAPPAAPQAGEVSTLTAALSGADDLALTAAGSLLVSQPNINYVQELSEQGVASPYVRDLSQPQGIALDDAGRLYIANVGTQQVLSAGSDGLTEVFAEMPGGASSVWVHPDTQEVYLPGYDSGLLEKVDAQGARSEVWQGPADAGLSAITVDDAGQLYTGNALSGEIYRHDGAGGAALLATLPEDLGDLAWVDGLLVASSPGGYRLYTITEGGLVELFAGIGSPGSLDGEALESRFEGPKGMIWDAGASTLYVAETTGAVRRVEIVYED